MENTGSEKKSVIEEQCCLTIVFQRLWITNNVLWNLERLNDSCTHGNDTMEMRHTEVVWNSGWQHLWQKPRGLHVNDWYWRMMHILIEHGFLIHVSHKFETETRRVTEIATRHIFYLPSISYYCLYELLIHPRRALSLQQGIYSESLWTQNESKVSHCSAAYNYNGTVQVAQMLWNLNYSYWSKLVYRYG